MGGAWLRSSELRGSSSLRRTRVPAGSVRAAGPVQGWVGAWSMARLRYRRRCRRHGRLGRRRGGRRRGGSTVVRRMTRTRDVPAVDRPRRSRVACRTLAGVGTGDSPVRLHAHRRRLRSIGATGSRSRPVRVGRWARHDGDRRENARDRAAGDPHRPTARSRCRPGKALRPTGRSAGANGPATALRHTHGTRADARRRDPLGSCSSDAARVAVGEQQRNRLAQDASCCRGPVSAPPRGPRARRDAIRRTRTPPAARALASGCGHPGPKRRAATGR